MNRHQRHPVAEGKTVLVIELERDLRLPPRWWQITVSLPGREGTFRRRIETGGDRSSDSDMSQLYASICKMISEAVMITEGVQLELRIEPSV